MVTKFSGSLALLLHAHLPFVRHPEHDEFHEEDWLFEGVVETYIPLLQIFRRLASERVPVRVTLTMTPTLCAMLRDPLLQHRTERYLDRVIELSRREIERTANDPALNQLARFYSDRFRSARDFYLK
jgi:1,4-alpha-glucan branching enzyme